MQGKGQQSKPQGFKLPCDTIQKEERFLKSLLDKYLKTNFQQVKGSHEVAPSDGRQYGNDCPHLELSLKTDLAIGQKLMMDLQPPITFSAKDI